MNRRWFYLFAFVLLAGCGGNPPPLATVANPAPGLGNWVTLRETRSRTEPPLPYQTTNQVVLHLTWVDLPVYLELEMGVADFFQGAVPGTPGDEDAWAGSDIVQVARANTNVVLTTNLLQVSTGTASPAAFSNFIARVQGRPDVALSASNHFQLAPGQLGQFSRGNTMTIVAGSVSTPTVMEGVVLTTTQVTLDQSVTLRAWRTAESNYLIRATSLSEQFRGYASSKAGDPEPRPSFHIAVLAGEAEIGPDEVLVLAGEPQPMVIHFTDNVPYLSALPGIGRFFTRSGTQTNYHRPLIFVQPSSTGN